jgi:regulation of enolase protein 1 (concanavalin A-like superfamily)
VEIPSLPFELHWLREPLDSSVDGATATIVAGPQTDWFVAPGGGSAKENAPALVGPVSGDFLLSARVEVDFAASFDAGALMLWRDERTWAKLCFEFSPQGQPMVVSVVTRELSDDCNSVLVDGNAVWLRIARIGKAYAFHTSTDGSTWSFVRHFALAPADELEVGLEAQSPVGERCTVRFSDIRFSADTLRELRDGS